MQIQQFIFREMKEYDDQMLRPFAGNASASNLRDLEESTDGGRDLSVSRLAGIAGKIIRPSTEVHGKAAIVNGWGEQRMMFAMTVLVRDTDRSQIIHEITGYTGYMGATNSLRGVIIDEKMPLYFNSVTRIGRNLTNTTRGKSWLTNIARSNQIISQQVNPDFTMAKGRSGTLTMRPEDIFGRNSTNPVFAERVKRAGGTDMRGSFTDIPMKLSNRLNTSSTRWMHRSLEALVGSSGEHSLNDPYGIEESPEKVYKEARGRVREDAVTTDPVMEEIAQDSNVLYDGFVTYGELMQMDPDFNWDDIPVYFHDKAMRRSLRGDFRPWDGTDNETVAASMLMSALPMYLINFQLAAIDFTATNINTMGDMVVVTSNASAIMEGPNLRDIVPIFANRLESEILKDILPWPTCSIDLDVSTSVAGETYVKINLDEKGWEEFVFPVFCDSAISPILTESQDYIDGMASTIADIGSSLGSSHFHSDNDRPRSRIITEPSRIDRESNRPAKRLF